MKRDEAGSAVVEFVWLSLLLLIPFVYILVAVFDTQRAAFGVAAASRSAARAFLQSPDVQSGQERARVVAQVALDDQGLTSAKITISCLPTPSDCLQPGSSVQVAVEATQRLPLTPPVLGDQIGGIHVDSSHIEPYGTFRSGR